MVWRLPSHVLLVGYETLREDTLESSAHPALHCTWDVVVLDEASKIKNRDSGVSRAVKRLIRSRRWVLTGTPLENRVEDLLSILEFLLGDPGVPWHSPEDTESLRAILSEVQLRRRKGDVLRDLPPKTTIDVDVDLGNAQRIEYERAEQEGIVKLYEHGPQVRVTHVLELILRLKQLCNCSQTSGESAKLDDMAERLGVLAAEGHKALAFSQFTDSRFGTDLIANRLCEFSPLTYDGSLSPSRRAAVIDRFNSQERHKLLALSVRAGAFGLNLQIASYVFHFDSWWNPAVEDQASARAHRMGQIYPVTVIRYICRITVEERIRDILATKRMLFEELVDDVSLDLASVLTEGDLFGLFGIELPPKSP